MQARILATGRYLPERVVANDDLVQFPANGRKLVEAKTGVRERRYAARDENTSDLGAKAAARCLERAGVAPGEVDAILLATSSPDRIQPATATRVQHLLGAGGAFACDVGSVCSGSVAALALGSSLVRSGQCRKVLVVAAEVYSRILNHKDYSTCPYFGDGAGAALLGENDDPARGVLLSRLCTDGSKADMICIPGGGVMLPPAGLEDERDAYFHMDGRAVYEFAVEKGSEIIAEVLERTGLGASDIAAVVPHQANLNILRELAGRTGIPMESFVVNLDRYGNTAGASVLIALDEALEQGRVGPDDTILTVSYGGGLTWGANCIVL